MAQPRRAHIVVRFSPSLDRCQTRTRYRRSTQVLARASILIGLMDYTRPGRYVSPADLQALAAHEFGHALGIQGHSPYAQDLMYPTLDGNRSVTTRDLATLHHAYAKRM